jgi:steroid 5-alpha reductase family enzyme
VVPPELVLPLSLCAGAFGLCWVLSLVFREYSWVDRLWSIIPPVYVGTLAYAAGGQDVRLNLMTALTALWGARLTFNYARKGGYAPGGEDYRWGILKARMKPWQWQLFNVGFIAGYQNLLLLLIALPAWTAYQHPTPVGPLDLALAALFLALLLGEFVADQQQWRFHQAKKARAQAGQVDPKGFLDTGLWAYSRHPNFFCELGQWWVVYAFAAVASGQPVHVTLLGPVLLTLLFHGSANFTESITASKYPRYAEYQRRVSRIVPMPARAEAASPSAASS